jgi:hypothetical protein
MWSAKTVVLAGASVLMGLVVGACGSTGPTDEELQARIDTAVATAVAAVKQGPPGERGPQGLLGPAAGDAVSTTCAQIDPHPRWG